MGFVKLLLAICFEVFATSFLKLSKGYTVLVPSLLSIGGYIISFFLLSQALKTFSVSVAYTIWSGIGTLGIFLVGAYFFHERLTTIQILGMFLVLVGAGCLHWGGERAFQ